jgi:hypothetical protein
LVELGGEIEGVVGWEIEDEEAVLGPPVIAGVSPL